MINSTSPPVFFNNIRAYCRSVFLALIFVQILLLLTLPETSVARQQDSTGTQLERYLQTAAQNNAEIKSLFYNYRSVLEQAPQAGTLPDPEIMFMYFANPRSYSNPLSRMTISATQKLPWFGTLNTAEKRIQNLAKAEFDKVVDTRNNLFRDIKEVWFRMYEIKHHISIFRQNLELLQMLESTAMTLYETGKVSQIDVIRFQIEIDEINTRIEQMQDKLGPMQIRFNALLNRTPETEINMPMPMEQNTLDVAPEQIIHKIQVQNPELSQLDHQKRAAEYALKNAQLDGLPAFGLGIEAMFPNYMYMPLMPGERTALIAKLSISVPLYRNKYNAQQREAKFNIQSVVEEKIQEENMLISEAKKSLQEYRDSQYRISLYEEKLIPKTRQALNIAIENYSGATGNFEDLIQLQQQILEYEMGLNTAYVERNITVADLEYLSGTYNINLEEM